jgi:hyperosmotically inducible protein
MLVCKENPGWIPEPGFIKKRQTMITIIKRLFLLVATLAFAVALPAGEWPDRPISPKAQQRLEREVRHELVMLPFYGVFDNLANNVNGYNIVLTGQVTRPTLKADAEAAVKRIEGVENVVNNIEVLPLSPNDDRIRLAVYRALFSDPSLDRYALQAVPPIHIIVKGGHITLEGVVANEGDRTIANIRARQVPGAFSVTNHLRIER